MPRRTQPLVGQGPLVTFARDLRNLQARTGGSAREAEAFGASRTAVYDALAGKRLPSVATLECIVTAWGAKDELERWRLMRLSTEEALAELARLRGEVKAKRTEPEERFKSALNSLWVDAGMPPQNQWGTAAGLSPRTVGAYLEGKTLPMPGKMTLLINGLARLCESGSELEGWVLQQGAVLREEHLYQARLARSAARTEARKLAKALPGGQASSQGQEKRTPLTGRGTELPA